MTERFWAWCDRHPNGLLMLFVLATVLLVGVVPLSIYYALTK